MRARSLLRVIYDVRIKQNLIGILLRHVDEIPRRVVDRHCVEAVELMREGWVNGNVGDAHHPNISARINLYSYPISGGCEGLPFDRKLLHTQIVVSLIVFYPIRQKRNPRQGGGKSECEHRGLVVPGPLIDDVLVPSPEVFASQPHWCCSLVARGLK